MAYPNTQDSFPDYVDKRSSGVAISNEQHTIPASTPYEFFLIEVPDSTVGVSVSGSRSYTYQATSPTASGQFTVDYKTGKLTFFSTDAGDVVRCSYTGLGSCVHASSINDIADAIQNIEATLGTNVAGQKATVRERIQASVGNLEVYSVNPEGKKVNISDGWYFPNVNARYAMSNYVMDLSAGGTHPVGGMPAGFFRRVIISLRQRGEVALYQGNSAAVSSNAFDPIPPSYAPEVPIASILIRQKGTAVPGDIDNIYNADITDWRPFLSAKVMDTDADVTLRTLSVRNLYQTEGYWSISRYGEVNAKEVYIVAIHAPNFNISAQGNANFGSGEFTDIISAKEVYLKSGTFSADSTGRVDLRQIQSDYFNISKFGTANLKNMVSPDADITYAHIQDARADRLRFRDILQSVNAKFSVDPVTGNLATVGTVDGVDVDVHDHSGAGQGGTVSHQSLSNITGAGRSSHHYAFEGQKRDDRMEYGFTVFAANTRKDVTFSIPFIQAISVVVTPAGAAPSQTLYTGAISNVGFSIYTASGGSVTTVAYWMAAGYGTM